MGLIVSRIQPERLANAKIAYTVRRVRLEDTATLIKGANKIKPGDLLLAKMVKKGQHQRIELTNGRRSRLFFGDEIVVCYGNRYAPQQFEAVIPDNSMEPCHLIAAGGIAARLLSKHDKMKMPTVIEPIGILGDKHGAPLNVASYAMEKVSDNSRRPMTIAIIGSTMDAGKTTAAASLINGLTKTGMRVGAAKITGTGAGGDIWFMKDAGADPVLDFIDAGYPSTFLTTPEQLNGIMTFIIDQLCHEGVDAIVIEVADGLYQEETASLLSSQEFKERTDGIIFASIEAMGAHMGVEWLIERDLPIIALSGVVGASPLATREAHEATGLPVLDLPTLSNPSIIDTINFLLEDRQATLRLSLSVMS